MTFYAFGLNYETASVDATEAFALDPETQETLYRAFDLGPESEVILLSTCNRTEVYLYGTEEDVRRVKQAVRDVVGRRWPASSFRLADEDAVRHVLQVTSGIRSMVVGDGQILSQVKDAYRRAVDAGTVDSLLHRLMHTAFRAAKRVANETDLTTGAASVSTAAVAMATDHFARRGVDNLEGVRALLIGAGKMGRLAVGALQNYAPASLTVINRSPERAREVADKHGADTVAWEKRYEAVAASDFVIVATGAPKPVLEAGQLPQVDLHAEAAAKLLVDISMPHNIDPAIDEVTGYTVSDLDDLKTWTEQVQEERGNEIPHAREICEDLLSDFVTWVFHQQALQPAIQAIRTTFDDIRKQEVDRHAQKTGMNREEVDRLTKSIMQKLLAVPIVKLKNVDPDSISFVQGIQLLHALFSRPSCEDESAQNTRAALRTLPSDGEDSQPSLSDAPAECPYITHDPDRSGPSDESDNDYATRLLRQALQAHAFPSASTAEPPSASEGCPNDSSDA